MGEHVTSHMQSKVGKSFVELGLQVKKIEGPMYLSQRKSAKSNERTPAPTYLRDENGVYAEDLADGSSCSQQGWLKLLMIAYNVTHDVLTLYYDNMNATTMSKNSIQHSWTKHIMCYHLFIRKLVEDKFIDLKHEMQSADKFARDLSDNQFEYVRGKLGIVILEELWQLMWSGKGNKNIVCPIKRKSQINDELFPNIGNSIYANGTLYLNTTLSIFIKPLKEPLLGQRNFYQKLNNMSQHPSSSGSNPTHHARTPSMEFLDEDVLDVIPLYVIPGDTPGSSSMAGSKQGNIPEKSPHKDDIHFTGRTIKNLVTRILNEEQSDKGVSTPLSRRDPSPEVETQAEKDDDSSKSEKEVADEGLCSLGKNLPSKKPAS
ncbi:hypothetical protein KIW84_055235 [Lathyrus oleraceus]|uniref:Uncharacterized protein n=1 Tax=Pisum sativum TaxID=3888 RepID=A0A9D4WV86_PEA|nr:hypothetical protein KIW84_055235 [Pisum sativum]